MCHVSREMGFRQATFNTSVLKEHNSCSDTMSVRRCPRSPASSSSGVVVTPRAAGTIRTGRVIEPVASPSTATLIQQGNGTTTTPKIAGTSIGYCRNSRRLLFTSAFDRGFQS